MHTIFLGDKILEDLVRQEVPFTAVRFESAIVQFRKSAEFAKNQNIIAEATALSRLGHVYDMLSDKLQAKRYFKNCLSVVEDAGKSKYEKEGKDRPHYN